MASILTKNKNAFDSIPHLPNSTFPLKSPGPFLGKTRLVENDKTKSFSFEDGLILNFHTTSRMFENSKKPPIKLFGGEVKITQTSGETKSYKIDGKEPNDFEEFGSARLSENRVVKSGLQSGGTVLQSKPSYNVKADVCRSSPDAIRFDLDRCKNDKQNQVMEVDQSSYTNITDFSQKAAKMLAPNLPIPVSQELPPLQNPINIFVNGRIVRYVPGMPGPVAPHKTEYSAPQKLPHSKSSVIKTDTAPPSHSPEVEQKALREKPIQAEIIQKFARPNSLALKPSITSQKLHHGLTPTMFNQILISPETPRVSKKCIEHFLHGNYFSYLGLKSSTKSVYCTLNKTQPFYVPHFKKLSMYSEWRQQDTKGDKLYVSGYDSRQKQWEYVTAGKANVNLVVHSSYKVWSTSD